VTEFLVGLDPHGVVEGAGIQSRKAAPREAPTEAETDCGAVAPGRADVRANRTRGGPDRDRADAPTRTKEAPAVGCGFRPALVAALFDDLSEIDVWEHIVDWYIQDGDRGRRRLASFAAATPITLHSLKLSVGSAGLDRDHVAAVAALVRAAGVAHVSDHLAFCAAGGVELAHFAPLWRTEAQLEIVVDNVDRLQDAFGARVVLENPASPFDPGGELSTAGFLDAVASRTGCGVLLDLENLRVNAENGLVDADAELDELDPAHVVGVHLAGGTDADADDPALDTHSWPVSGVVYDWLAEVVARASNLEWIVVERDGRLGDAEEVVDDLARAHAVVARSRAEGVLAPGVV
jgi:uncharacterized protein (UPF0276 family)